jgi:hypothetical protein
MTEGKRTSSNDFINPTYFLLDYGDLTVEDVFPLYGPMCGNQKVCIESKGFLPKDLKTDLTVTLIESQTNWFHQIQDINKNRNNFIFSMPPYPYLRTTPAKVTLRIQYKDETIYESTYIYTRTLDGTIEFEFFFSFIYLFFLF